MSAPATEGIPEGFNFADDRMVEQFIYVLADTLEARSGHPWGDWEPMTKHPEDFHQRRYRLDECEVVENRAPNGEIHDRAILPQCFDEFTDPQDAREVAIGLLRAAWALEQAQKGSAS